MAALAVHIMTNTALTGATFDIDGGQQLITGALGNERPAGPGHQGPRPAYRAWAPGQAATWPGA
jgi:hypothetical protein